MTTRIAPIAVLAIFGCKTDVGIEKLPNVVPTAKVVSPADGAVFAESETVDLLGAVGDNNGLDDIVSVVWVSDLDNELGTSTPDEQGTVRLPVQLTPGTHQITLLVTDQEGGFGQDSVTVSVQGEIQVPSVLVTGPQDNGLYLSTEPIDLAGQVSDLQQAPNTLQLAWSFTPANGGARTIIASDPADAQGHAQSVWTDAQPGAWLVQLEATDQDGNSRADQVAVIVMHPDEADLDADGYPGATDCDDDDFDVNPGRNESCNDVDDDCSGEIDDKDLDGDGVIDENCTAYAGVLPVGDCNDTNAFIYPGAFEQADNADNNCDGRMDEGTTLYDDDGDCACEAAAICNGSDNPICLTLGYSDCDDTDAAMNNDDVDNDGASSCGGDCDDNDAALNLSDWDGDQYTTCQGDCDDFNAALNQITCPAAP